MAELVEKTDRARAEDGGQPVHNQKVLVLCGVVGSGKSTFATGLENLNPNFVRISQDVLGKRQACEAKARRCLEEGKSIIIDRQNFDRKQRLTWLKIAREFAAKSGQPNLEVVALEFATPHRMCVSRLQVRTGHETLHSAHEALGVLKLVSGTWAGPAVSEGFSRVLVLVPKGVPSRAPNALQIPFPLTPQFLQDVINRLDSLPAKNLPHSHTDASPPSTSHPIR